MNKAVLLDSLEEKNRDDEFENVCWEMIRRGPTASELVPQR